MSCVCSCRSNTPKEKRSKDKDPPPAIPDPYQEEYATVECASALPPAAMDQGFAETHDAVASGLKDRALMMVDCSLYTEPTEAWGAVSTKAQPDISPYACFYGAPKIQVLKVGWLDKLSPQG